MAITDTQFQKLPKYAQEEIERLNREIREKQSLLNSIGAAQKPTKVRVERDGGKERFVEYLDPNRGIEFVLPKAEGVTQENIVTVRIVNHPAVGDRLEIMGSGYPNALHITSQSSNVMHITTARY